jgi:sulfotransferase
MVNKIFFQSSMPRSGSTLFQNILGQNPDFYVTPTSGVLELLFGARMNFTNSPEFKAQDNELMEAGFKSFCKEGMYGFYNAITDKKYVLDKSRGWGVYRPFLSEVIEEPKIICMVRDLRSILSSYEKIYRKNSLRHDPIRNDATATGTTVHKRIDEWVHPTNAIGRALERLFEINRLGYSDKILYVKYEDLCFHPETEMKRIYEYLEIPEFQHDFDNIEQITKEDDAVYGLTPDLHTIRKSLDMNANDYREVLGKDICDWVQNNYQWYFSMFNYRH